MSDEWKRVFDEMGYTQQNLNTLDPTVAGIEVSKLAERFFSDCWRLRDWLCQTAAVRPAEVNQYINNDPYLSVCRDLANAHKHYQLTRRPKYDSVRRYHHHAGHIDVQSSTGHAELHDPDDIPGHLIPPTVPSPGGYLIVVDGSREFWLLDFVHECVLAWTKFLQDRQLL